MKQEVGSKNCVAIVACMATGCSVEEFEAFAGEWNEGYNDIDFREPIKAVKFTRQQAIDLANILFSAACNKAMTDT
ncbi:MAG TPA: hypothetical protein ENI23_07700 [bacterium]|nr:hypothetical protein [bacterium]